MIFTSSGFANILPFLWQWYLIIIFRNYGCVKEQRYHKYYDSHCKSLQWLDSMQEEEILFGGRQIVIRFPQSPRASPNWLNNCLWDSTSKRSYTSSMLPSQETTFQDRKFRGKFQNHIQTIAKWQGICYSGRMTL